MKFVLTEVGPVKKANVELAPLTIVCGKNNTGKTYLTNCIYELSRHLTRHYRVSVKEDVPAGFDRIEVDLNKYVAEVKDSIAKRVKSFNDSANVLHGGSIQIEYDDDELPIANSAPSSTWYSGADHASSFKVQKSGSVLTISRSRKAVESAAPKEKARAAENMAVGAIVNAYLRWQHYNNGFLPDAFSMTSERMGIAYFKDCLDIAVRAQHRENSSLLNEDFAVKEHMSANDKTLFPDNVYAMLDFISSVGQRMKSGRAQTSRIARKVSSALEELVGGTYAIEDGNINFTPSGGKAAEQYSSQEVSSSVRALFALDFYVRFMAEKGGILVIDEPEMNLHPEKQRQLARFLAVLVNEGIKVFLTTHSDYMIREFNLLMQLNSDDERLREIRTKEGYRTEELLNAKNVRAYMSVPCEGGFEFKPGVVSQKGGVFVEEIDAVIDDMNRVQELITWG